MRLRETDGYLVLVRNAASCNGTHHSHTSFEAASELEWQALETELMESGGELRCHSPVYTLSQACQQSVLNERACRPRVVPSAIAF